MNIKAIENHKVYLERLEFYRKFGYDLTQEREFILSCAQPLFGDILEIGTGKGHFALALAKQGVFFISVDLSAQEQEIAALNLEYHGFSDKVNLKLMNAASLDFTDKSFDVIFCVNVFHHLKEPLKVLKEITRVLKDKGKIILSDFTLEGMEIINRCHEAENRKHDHSANDIKDALNFFTAENFKLERKESKCQVVIIAER